MLRGANFGVSLPTVLFDGKEASTVRRVAGESSHTHTSFLLPRGAGAGLDVRVVAGGTASAPVAFAYAPGRSAGDAAS